ncbi:MAG: hypothetical protein DRQ44_17820, partial [Gammaproteobacteria bacterium]
MNSALITKRLIVYLFICSHFLVGCATTGSSGNVQVGPKSSSSYDEETIAIVMPKLDVIIPVFDPGLDDDELEEGVWPELRRAEANRFAYKLKQALDDTGEFGAVRVTPDSTASGDLYVLGKIDESDGEDVEFDLTVVDISGKQWLDTSFEHEVQETFYDNHRNTGQDPYDPVFKQAAIAIVKALKKRSMTELDNLKYIADLQFAASFNDTAFAEYLDSEHTPIKLIAKPSDEDPLLQRVQAIRVREQLFVDNLQQNYRSFSQNIDESYLNWQEASFREQQLQSEARIESIWKAVAAVALIGAAIAVAANGDDSYSGDMARDAAVIASGIGGAVLIAGAFKSNEEAALHQDAVDELGDSI